ncbi:MAG TPA: glycoside hydrolase family 172 protein [Opitutaceae bacterium]|nr:glycoside hydrolase family 172 protein [Opitutaceae bacterium]
MKTPHLFRSAIAAAALSLAASSGAQEAFSGLGSNMSNLYRTSSAQTRSVSAENPTGEVGKGGMATTGTGSHASRELGLGWKVSPSVNIKAGQVFTVADLQGPGCIQQIWMTPTGNWRLSILRFYWDGETEPSVEVPVADFFASGWGKWDRCALINSMPICVNPRCAFNSYWQMPFHKSCRITMENLDDKDMVLYYQVNYTLTDVPADAGTFHAQFRRENPLKTKGTYTIVDGIRGKGQYVGTYLAVGVHNTGWWGEGEVKFYIDGDKDFPTICGTGTEDYFCGSYDFEGEKDGKTRYVEFTTPYAGMPQVIRPDGLYDSQQRFSLYRWHITDPVRFEKGLKVTIQDLGWQSGGRYLPEQDDIASVAFWYQTGAHDKYPALPTRDELEWH